MEKGQQRTTKDTELSQPNDLPLYIPANVSTFPHGHASTVSVPAYFPDGGKPWSPSPLQWMGPGRHVAGSEDVLDFESSFVVDMRLVLCPDFHASPQLLVV